MDEPRVWVRSSTFDRWMDEMMRMMAEQCYQQAQRSQLPALMMTAWTSCRAWGGRRLGGADRWCSVRVGVV